MTRLKQVEFAKLCGIAKSSLPIYIQRNKIIIEDGLIDDEHPANVTFRLKQAEKQKLKESNKSEENTREIEEKVQNSTINKAKRDNSHKGSAYHELEKIKKELDIEKTAEEIELLKKKNMKMDGESIPTDIVLSLNRRSGKETTIAFHNAAENWLTKIAKMKGLSNIELAEMRTDLIKGINEAVLKIQIETKKAISEIIKEYSLKREVGEHE